MLFAGGRSGCTLHDIVDIHDASTGLWSMAQPSVARTLLAGSTVGNLALFSGGSMAIGAGTDVIDVFDAATSTCTSRSGARGTSVLAARSAALSVPVRS